MLLAHQELTTLNLANLLVPLVQAAIIAMVQQYTQFPVQQAITALLVRHNQLLVPSVILEQVQNFQQLQERMDALFVQKEATVLNQVLKPQLAHVTLAIIVLLDQLFHNQLLVPQVDIVSKGLLRQECVQQDIIISTL